MVSERDSLRSRRMATPKTQTKQRISSAEAQKRLVDVVIQLVETVPLQELTVRRISKEAGTDPKTIFRNFLNLEELFVAAVRELEQRMMLSLEAGEGDFRPVAPAVTYTKLVVWLYLSGTPSNKLQPSPEVVASFRALSIPDLEGRPEISERAKNAYFLLVMAFLAGQATVGAFQPDVFTPEATLDVVNLISALNKDISRIAEMLGWNV
jgi:AcrR family transcriptional regulator